MCRMLKVLIVAPADRHLDLRRRLSSLEYDVVATVEADRSADVTADVALVYEQNAGVVGALKDRGVKVVSVGSGPDGDLSLTPDELGTFPQRVWELFRAG
jgi:hypothetical protein